MSIAGGINNLLKSSNFLVQLRAIQAIAVSDLQQAVQATIYAIPASPNYTRTFDLLNSITAGDLQVTANSIEFKVYFDPEKTRHTSLWGSKKLGISAGEYVEIADWLNDGFSWGDSNDREAAHFMEKAIIKIQADMVGRVKNAINIEVKRIYDHNK
jgi:hypothetical protein